jgi:EpsI family protein
MRDFRSQLQSLASPTVIAASALLLIQAAGYYGLSRPEQAPEMLPLRLMPETLGPWKMSQQIELDEQSMQVLRPDDYVLRVYIDPDEARNTSIFVAYFRSQRSGHAPHSPQNCLPGNGWVPDRRETVPVAVDGGSIAVNRIRVAKGEQKSVVYYWYQTASRVIASEYQARFQLVMDSIRFNRSDTALVRIVLPLKEGESDEAVAKAASELIGRVYTDVHTHLPELN